jgi:HEAT repeat protein
MAESEVDALFAQTLEGDYSDDAPWQAVCTLHRIGTRQIFDKAVQWTQSAEPLLRARGIDVLAQLGKSSTRSTTRFPEESFDVVTKILLDEQELRPLNSAISALGHIGDPRAIPLVAAFHSHASAGIRFTVAFALGSFPDDALSVQTLLMLLEDADDEVRDWATFGLGVLGDYDSPEVREALYRRLDDTSDDVREEALAGLAKRHDTRILPTLIEALEQPTMTDRIVQAAYTLLGFDKDQEDWSGKDYVSALRQRFQL